MKHLFYLFVGILALYEVLKTVNCKKIYSRKSEYRYILEEEGVQKAKAYLRQHPALLAMVFLDIVGWFTLIGGLMTNQWILFLAVMVLYLSRFKRLGSWFVLLDILATPTIYIFSIINAYYLHIPL